MTAACASCRRNNASRQGGALLVEGLVAILIFSLGVLSLVGLQALSIRQGTEARYRAEASLLANRLLGQMWAEHAQGSDAALLQTRLAGYAHHAQGAPCTQGNAPSADPLVTDWLSEVAAALPGAAAARQHIAITEQNAVQITLCWQSQAQVEPHHYRATALISY